MHIQSKPGMGVWLNLSMAMAMTMAMATGKWQPLQIF